jgi:hypothetical protein
MACRSASFRSNSLGLANSFLAADDDLILN